MAPTQAGAEDELPVASTQAEAEVQRSPTWTQAEAAQYIAAMAGELSLLARHAKLDLVSYLLDMARLEADNASRPRTGSGR
jgi:hypothetical protein